MRGGLRNFEEHNFYAHSPRMNLFVNIHCIRFCTVVHFFFLYVLILKFLSAWLLMWCHIVYVMALTSNFVCKVCTKSALSVFICENKSLFKYFANKTGCLDSNVPCVTPYELRIDKQIRIFIQKHIKVDVRNRLEFYRA